MKLYCSLVLGLALSCAPMASGQVTFTDDFTTGATSYTLPSAGGINPKAQALPNGFFRTLLPENVSFAVAGLDTLTLQIFTGSGGYLDYAASSGASATTDIEYGTPGTPLSITANQVLRLDIAAIDAPNAGPTTVQVILNPGDPSEYDSSIIPITTGGPQTLDIPLLVGASALATPAFDVLINSHAGNDYRLNSVSVESVPEPTALALVGLAALVTRRRGISGNVR